VLHLVVAATGWTLAVYHDLDAPHEWERHVTAIAAYGLVVVVVAPTLLGLGLGATPAVRVGGSCRGDTLRHMANDPRVIREGGYQGAHDPPPPPASMYGPQIVPAPSPASTHPAAPPARPADAD
jgi:hypothetical protein